MPNPTEWPIALSEADVGAIVAMAWRDDTPFEAIEVQFGLSEKEVVALMRGTLKPRSFRVWRMRVRGRAAKHQARQNHGERLQDVQAATAKLEAQTALASVSEVLFPQPQSPLSREALT